MAPAPITPTVDPAEVGVDPDRLARIDAVTHEYVDSGKFPCVQFVMARRGEIVHHDIYGHADVEDGRPIRDDSIYRIYSMTKPVTSVALMMLYEEGKVLLENPVSRFIPAFEGLRVFESGNEVNAVTREADREMTVHDVLRHTSGLTYGFQHQHAVDAIYRKHSLGDFTPNKLSLTETMDLLGTLPLQFSPGEGWCYSMSTDVCGAIVEAVSGQSLDQFFQERIFDPLGMTDTAFWVDGDNRRERFTSNYVFFGGNTAKMDPWDKSGYLKPPPMLSGGGGLVSTMADYHRFTQMLINGGVLDGARLLGPRTVDFMTTNHLPGGQTLNEMGQVGFAEVAMEGLGFGLGFSVNESPAANGGIGSVGDYGWGGAASTVFSIDPAEELVFILMTQLLPSSTYPIRRQLRSAVYQSLVD
ncbi:serine hydrolase domain-containing protein [Actinospongicola halichondriae]|uniref:serine hydrolase domain-containing protein n=1 Tax=Actinospongicola halichondriae TaxID=3236844 RepID=UPI003D49180D